MTSTQNRIAGIADLTVDGITYQLVGKFSYRTGPVTRETKSGQDQPHGYKEMPIPPRISATLRDSDGLKIADINAMTDVDIVATLANGKTVVGDGMWTVDAQTVDSEEGEFEVAWEGMAGSVTEN